MLIERINQVYAYVKGMHCLPDYLENSVRGDPDIPADEREGWLALFFLTAQHWTIWEHRDGTRHKGMAYLTGCIDMEYLEKDTFPGLNFNLPTLRAHPGRDWRVGTFDLSGRDMDESPLDVQWMPDQIDADEDEDSASV
jgi:hypothetical protein